VAFAPLGWEAAWFSEVDVQSSQILAHSYGATAPVFPLNPDEEGLGNKERKARINAIKSASRLQWGTERTNWGDMVTVRAMVMMGEAEAPEIVVGGPPCQSFSIAGLRGGLHDRRGQLTLEYCRIIDAVDRRRQFEGKEPCVALYENVPAITSDKTNAFGCLLAGLAGEDVPLVPAGRKWTNAGVVLGPKRAVAWRTLDAQWFGLAQRRKRVFVVASAREGFDPGAILLEFDGLRRDSAPSRKAREDLAGTLEARTRAGGFPGTEGAIANHVVPAPHPRSDLSKGYRLVSFGEYADDELASTMKSRDYKDVTDIVAQPVIAFDSKETILRPNDNLAPCLTTNGEAGKSGGRLAVAYSFPAEMGATAYASEGDLSQALTAKNTTAICFSAKDYGGDASEELAPTLRAMGHDSSHANGGGQLAVCVTGEITHALKAEGADASEDGTGRGNPIVPVCVSPTLRAGNHPPAVALKSEGVVWAVRRLMPVECERLQGFPDFATLYLPGGKEAADGPRYRQLGNSWAIPCVAWIGARIEFALRGGNLVSRRREIEALL